MRARQPPDDAEAAGASALRAKVAELLWLLNELKEAVARHADAASLESGVQVDVLAKAAAVGAKANELQVWLDGAYDAAAEDVVRGIQGLKQEVAKAVGPVGTLVLAVNAGGDTRASMRAFAAAASSLTAGLDAAARSVPSA